MSEDKHPQEPIDPPAPDGGADAGDAPRLRQRGSNQIGMRQFNDRVVLQALRVHGSMPKAELARLTGIAAVMAVHSTNGKWDLIAELATQTLLELDEVIYRIRSIEGVVTSETNLLLSTRKAGRK